MARIEHTPWEPGCIVLSDEDIRGKNPYIGKCLNPIAILNMLPAIGNVCWQLDSSISQIQQDSKHSE
jgi:hypothetical protein